MKKTKYKQIFQDIVDVYDGLSIELAAQTNPRGTFVGCLLRLAGHDFMDYRENSSDVGGSDGCINFNDGDNKGLKSCLLKYDIPGVYTKYKNDVSLADFVVIIAEAAMARANGSYNADAPFVEGTLANKFMYGFKYGRKTTESCEWTKGRMPNPEHGCEGRDGHDGLK